MNLFVILIIVLAVIIIFSYQAKKNKKKKGEVVVREIQKLYWKLNDTVIPLYNFKKCPTCGSKAMNIRNISPTGKSIEYSCEHCDEVLSCTLISGKNPRKAMHIQEEIKMKIIELRALIGDEIHNKNIDITFKIN
ncbi:hypothetical protein [Gaoshiqia sediminis]|uniref:Uncharacterized protein n=1 Tax=Gaoshiqia sediminis TaxID=2986998 RepID=A0AA42C810_9BACT|nr:hypothetical protein [Gaoshiqia sediminis]MCW0484144.1 hypothetical protein [Gaoshiqia sediminis]